MNDLLKEARQCVTIPFEFTDEHMSNVINKILDHYEELLNKEEGVKPKYDKNAKWKTELYCSNCNNWIGSTTDKTNKYCCECGTKIDWSDT